MAKIGFNSLPFEIRALIYNVCVEDLKSHINILTLSRDIHEEVQRLIYDERNLVFNTHLGFLLNHNFENFRQLQNGLVTVSLEHPRKAPIVLPPLPWNRQRCESQPHYRHLPIDYMVRECKTNIMIHIYEPLEDDDSQDVLSYWAVNGICEFLQELYPEDSLRLQIIAHPLPTGQSCTYHGSLAVTNAFSWWKSIYRRDHGDLTFILATLWADTEAYLEIHATKRVAENLATDGFSYISSSAPRSPHSIFADIPKEKHLEVFPPLDLLSQTQPLIAGGLVVGCQGNTWRSLYLRDQPHLELLFGGIPDYALVMANNGLQRICIRTGMTSEALLDVQVVDLEEFPWNNPKITATYANESPDEDELAMIQYFCDPYEESEWDYFGSVGEDSDQDHE